jgi:eukaryotic-like serine/threonine-protein kinase
MDFRKRMEWAMHMGLLVFILAAVAFLSAITTIRIAIRSSQVQMPNLSEKTVQEAQTLLQQRGLDLKIADRVYDALPAGRVVRQIPPAGTQVKVSQNAHVVISLGQMKVTVPSIEGASLRMARITLLQAGLQLGEVTEPYLNDSSVDTVIQQTQRPGVQASSPRVDVLVDQGPRPPAYVMPFFIGLPGGDAQRQLTSTGFHNIRITPIPAPQWPAGTVIDQTPPPGARAATDGQVEIKIAEASTAPASDIHHEIQ